MYIAARSESLLKILLNLKIKPQKIVDLYPKARVKLSQQYYSNINEIDEIGIHSNLFYKHYNDKECKLIFSTYF